MSNKLDKLIVQFKDSEPDFYNEYLSARKVVITGARSAKPENVVAVPGTPTTKAA